MAAGHVDLFFQRHLGDEIACASIGGLPVWIYAAITLSCRMSVGYEWGCASVALTCWVYWGTLSIVWIGLVSVALSQGIGRKQHGAEDGKRPHLDSTVAK